MREEAKLGDVRLTFVDVARRTKLFQLKVETCPRLFVVNAVYYVGIMFEQKVERVAMSAGLL